MQAFKTMTVDVHGMTTAQAKQALERLLSSLPKEYSEVLVLHGYHMGTALQQMVRKQLKHPRLARVCLTLNPGETRLVLK